MDLEGKNIVVVGLARSGLAMARFLCARGARVTVTDQATAAGLGAFAEEARELGVRLELGGHRIDSFLAADLVVISPGVPHDLPPLKKAGRAGIPVIGEIELASRFIQIPLVAITGTNGKTTTTEMVGRILAAAGRKVFVGGNIGNPLIEIVSGQKDLDLIVAEVSSFQLDTTTSFRPRVAVLLNISADHLDRYPDMEAYVASKARIFANQQPEDTAVFNADDPRVAGLAPRLTARKMPFYTRSDPGRAPADAAAIVMEDRIVLRSPSGKEQAVELSKSCLMGTHNRQNMAAAALAAMAAGAGLDAVGSVLNSFETLDHRLETVALVKGVRFVNDSKATNIDAVARALECFSTPVILIMGGRNKGYDFRSLRDHVRRRVKKLIVMGEAADEITDALGHLPPGGTTRAADMKEAVRQAFESAASGETVLLSPACASFDMFGNYAERGREFRRQVEALN